MADNLVELDDLLRRFHAKESAAAKTATSPSAPKVEETTRPFQTLCNEAIRAYGDANVDNGETTLDALREEVASAGVSADKPPVLPLSNAYAANRNERLRLLEGMYDSCLRAVSAAKQGVRSARSRAKALLKARTATADAKKKAWEKKAGAVSKQQYANVSDQLRRVETDWASLVEGNGRLEALQGGGGRPGHAIGDRKSTRHRGVRVHLCQGGRLRAGKTTPRERRMEVVRDGAPRHRRVPREDPRKRREKPAGHDSGHHRRRKGSRS